MTHLWWPPVATGGPPVATTKWVTATMVATGGAAMGNAVATGGLPWVVSTGTHVEVSHLRNLHSAEKMQSGSTLFLKECSKQLRASFFDNLWTNF